MVYCSIGLNVTRSYFVHFKCTEEIQMPKVRNDYSTVLRAPSPLYSIPSGDVAFDLSCFSV